MEFLDVHNGMMVSSDKIIAIEAVDDLNTAVHVQFGSEVRVFYKNIPYSVLKDILLARQKQEGKLIDSSVSRSLEQLAKYQAIPVP